MWAIGSVGLQVNAIDDDRSWNFCRTIPILPPFADELTLINDSVCKARADQGQHHVAILRSNVIARTGPAYTLNPVDTVKALHDPLSALTGLS